MAKMKSPMTLTQAKPELTSIKGFMQQQAQSYSMRVLNVLKWIAPFRGDMQITPLPESLAIFLKQPLFHAVPKARTRGQKPEATADG